jgi:hypothetical protein
MMVQVCNPSSWEAEADGSRVQANVGFIVRSYLKKQKTIDFCIAVPMYKMIY